MPRQVMVEFWRSRESVLQDPRDTGKTLRELTDLRDRAVSTLRTWANRVGLSQERRKALLGIVTGALDEAEAEVQKLADSNASEFAHNTNIDPVLMELDSILRDRVGRGLSPQQHQDALAEAKRRGEAKVPPGYKDFAKGGEAYAGDYLIWTQVLGKVQHDPRDVLIVTGDAKEDWWRREHGELRGPRPELAEEMETLAGVKLFMVRPKSLLMLAGRILKMKVNDESLEDIERTDRYLAAALKPSVGVVQESWADVLQAVKKRRRVSWMILSNASPSSLDGDVLTIEFARDGDLKGFHASGCDKDLSAAVHNVFGVHLRVAGVTQRHVAMGERAEESPEDPWVHDEQDSAELTGLELIRRELGDSISEEPPF